MYIMSVSGCSSTLLMPQCTVTCFNSQTTTTLKAKEGRTRTNVSGRPQFPVWLLCTDLSFKCHTNSLYNSVCQIWKTRPPHQTKLCAWPFKVGHFLLKIDHLNVTSNHRSLSRVGGVARRFWLWHSTAPPKNTTSVVILCSLINKLYWCCKVSWYYTGSSKNPELWKNIWRGYSVC